MMEVYETDWLGTRSVFYNEKTLKVSERIKDVIDFSNVEIDQEGLYYYAKLGYCGFTKTPIKHVRFLSPNSKLFINQNSLKVERKHDSTLDWLGKTVFNEDDIWDLMNDKIVHSSLGQKEIVIPTSGGYDSRILNVLTPNKSAIKSYTFSCDMKIHERSYEVVFAQELSRTLNTDWNKINLSRYHEYLDEWDDIFGISSHSHGMYQMEFYDILKSKHNGALVLSGIIGDLWSKDIPTQKITRPFDLLNLGYTHGFELDTSQLISHPVGFTGIEEEYEAQKDTINEQSRQAIMIGRLKMMLLKYLLVIPEYYGFKTASPFLDEELAMMMLHLPLERKKNRQWQVDFFKKSNVYLESRGLKTNTINKLNLNALRTVPLVPLNEKILSEYVNKEYILWINRNLTIESSLGKLVNELHYKRKIKEGLKILGFHNKNMKAYNAYLCLYPLQKLLEMARS